MLPEELKKIVSDKALKLYPKGRAQPNPIRVPMNEYIPLCEQAAFIEGCEFMYQQTKLLREALEKIRDTKEFGFMSTVVKEMKEIAKAALEK